MLVPGVPGLVVLLCCTSADPAPPLGVWKQAATDKVNLIRFEQGRMAQYRDGRLRFQRLRYEKNRIDRIEFAGEKMKLADFEIKEGVLWLTEASGRKVRFEKL